MEAQFIQATRSKLRFSTTRGELSVEDLWDLNLTSATGKPNLDDLAKSLNRALKSTDDESFVTPAVKVDDGNALRFEIVKSIIAVRLLERDAAAQAKEKAEKKQKIMGFIESKQDEALSNMPIEELRKLLESV